MNCKETQEMLHGFVDDEFDLARNLEIERHLQYCPDCSTAHKGNQALRSVIRSNTLYFNPPPKLEKRIKTALRKANKPETSARAGWLVWRWAGLAAAICLTVLFVWGARRVISTPSADDLLARDVVAEHIRSIMVIESARPRLINVPSSDKHTVKPWFNGKLDFSPPVPDLAAQNFQLIGGRMDYLANKSVAALVYQRGQHIINVFIWPTAEADPSPRQVSTSQGYNLFHWSKDGMTFWAVSDLNANELREFCQLVANQG